MSLKRSYQVQSKYTRNSKRARTLNSEVQKLKRQVASNKKELKYYDVTLGVTTQQPRENYSIFLSNNAQGWPEFQTDRQELFGRKIHVKKIEASTVLPELGIGNDFDIVTIYRESRPGKALSGTNWPLAFDPEYHTLLRQFDPYVDTTKRRHKATIDFGQAGRIVEFDNANLTGGTISTEPVITKGDIKVTYFGKCSINMRVWYTDD